jgi:hypothetical protein
MGSDIRVYPRRHLAAAWMRSVVHMAVGLAVVANTIAGAIRYHHLAVAGPAKLVAIPTREYRSYS